MRSHGADLVFVDKAAKKAISHALGGPRGVRLVEHFFNRYLSLLTTMEASLQQLAANAAYAGHSGKPNSALPKKAVPY